jgi:hypothetical protein
MRSGLRLSVALLGVSLGVPCAYAQDAAPADDIAALQRQLKELAERNQQQIDALQQQVQALTTALAKFHARRPAATLLGRASPSPAPWCWNPWRSRCCPRK